MDEKEQREGVKAGHYQKEVVQISGAVCSRAANKGNEGRRRRRRRWLILERGEKEKKKKRRFGG